MRSLQQEGQAPGEGQAKGKDGEEKGLLSGISDFFTQSISLKGGVPANMSMQSELQFNTMLPKQVPPEQMRQMQECLNKIDDILKRECIFCGPVLIDMIDNDIDQDEFGETQVQKNSLAGGLKNDEWAIV